MPAKHLNRSRRLLVLVWKEKADEGAGRRPVEGVVFAAGWYKVTIEMKVAGRKRTNFQQLNSVATDLEPSRRLR
jgi:hypothetical protein